MNLSKTHVQLANICVKFGRKKELCYYKNTRNIKEVQAENNDDENTKEGADILMAKITDNCKIGGSVTAQQNIKSENYWENLRSDLDTGVNVSLIGYTFYNISWMKKNHCWKTLKCTWKHLMEHKLQYSKK